MSSRLRHRGPDGWGVWTGGGVVIEHRRLAVIDPRGGAQPMRGDGHVLAYNGELYNDAELRDELAHDGAVFRSRCDTETLFAALSRWGAGAVPRLRGMFAFAFFDVSAGTVTLARDPLGIKPLYYAVARRGEACELAFASEIPAVLEHPWVESKPDWGVVSAYLTTLRTTLGERTLFDGVRCVRPGEVLVFRVGGGAAPTREVLAIGRLSRETVNADDDSAVRAAVEDSVRRHLRSDVPTCCLLSGGLDSAITATLARRELGELWTYCAGAREGGESPDFEFARRMSERLGTRHTEVDVDEAVFTAGWRELVGAYALPLSTPNEVAIHEVSRRLRADGKIVTISGEGADELFAGYDAPLREASRRLEAGGDVDGEFLLDQAAWIPMSAKADVLVPAVARGTEQDGALRQFYEAEWRGGDGEREPLRALLRVMRRVNLEGLLLRLDAATMRAGVEGRTPLSDAHLAALAERLPTSSLFDARVAGSMGSKIALRRAFADVLPADVLTRAKASFPLPFQGWLAGNAASLRESAFARGVFAPAAIDLVAGDPATFWRLAWPMINVAMWGGALWG